MGFFPGLKSPLILHLDIGVKWKKGDSKPSGQASVNLFRHNCGTLSSTNVFQTVLDM